MFSTWRKLWLYFAQNEKQIGIDSITDGVLVQMKAHLSATDEDFQTTRVEEKKRRHVGITAGTSQHGAAKLTSMQEVMVVRSIKTNTDCLVY